MSYLEMAKDTFSWYSSPEYTNKIFRNTFIFPTTHIFVLKKGQFFLILHNF